MEDLPSPIPRRVPSGAFAENARNLALRGDGGDRPLTGREGPPAGFHDAAREIHERLSDYKDTKPPPTVEEAARKLRRSS